MRDGAGMHSQDSPQQTDTVPNTRTVPRALIITQWIWVVIMGLSVAAALIAVLAEPGTLEWILLVGTVLQAGIAIPAALALPRGRPWARYTLIVLALFSVAAAGQSLQHHAWPSVVVNLVLVATLATLKSPEAKQHCRRRPTANALVEDSADGS